MVSAKQWILIVLAALFSLLTAGDPSVALVVGVVTFVLALQVVQWYNRPSDRPRNQLPERE